MKRLYWLTVCTVFVALGIFFYKKRTPTTIAAGEGLVVPKAWLAINQHPLTPEKDCRPPDQTYLTFPEWYLVFSPEEQAKYFTRRTSTSFPYMQHTAQIWGSYQIVKDQIRDNFPPNKGYHFMIWVIGSSASVEYTIKAWYEKLIGRITDTGIPITEEDQFNAQFTADYVAFIKDRPWYEFDFKSRLKELWTTVPLVGIDQARKLDRRYLLTSELLVKYGYGKLIGLGTKQVYEEALPTTAVILDNDSLQYLPRYDKFAAAVTDLAKQGHSLKEVAGNQSAILVSAIIGAELELHYDQMQMVFVQPVASDPTRKRVVFAVPVNALATVLLQMNRDRVAVEHVFDF